MLNWTPEMSMTYEVTRPGAGLTRGNDGDSGTDCLLPTLTDEFIRACVYTPADVYRNMPVAWYPDGDERYIVLPGLKGILIPTGIKVDLPHGFDITVKDKSGVAKNACLKVNGGLVDSPYTGEVHVHLMNLSPNNVVLQEGQKLAQFVIRPVCYPTWTLGVVDKVTSRGAGGHGSTGLFVQP